MVLSALWGAIGFLTRIPVGHGERSWEAFRNTPASLPLAGYLIGALVALPLVLPGPSLSVGLAFLIGIIVVTGITHLDGAADVGDAVAAHGDAVDRREILSDPVIGVGGALAVAVVVVGLTTAGIALSQLPTDALVLVVVAEVSAKAAMAAIVCLGTATHEGLGSALTGSSRPRSLVPVVIVTVPVLILPTVIAPDIALLVASICAICAAAGIALALFWWARSALGGVTGDVLGATNEFARIAALHAGVIAWTHL